jgi:hypothetical protein
MRGANPYVSVVLLLLFKPALFCCQGPCGVATASLIVSNFQRKIYS